MELIYHHRSITTTFSIFEHATVYVSAFILHLAPTVKSTFHKFSMFNLEWLICFFFLSLIVVIMLFLAFVVKMALNEFLNSSDLIRFRLRWFKNITKVISKFSSCKFIIFIYSHQLRLILRSFHLRIDHFSFPMFSIILPVSYIFDSRWCWCCCWVIDICPMSILYAISMFTSIYVSVWISQLYERILELISIKLAIEYTSVA